MKTFITHYTRLKLRKDFMIQQLKKYNVDYEIIEDFDKEKLTETDLSKFDTTKTRLNEISLSLKHYVAFRNIINNNLDYALILEDDACFDPNFDNLLKKCISELPDNWDCVFIGECSKLHVSSNQEKILYEVEHRSRGTAAYLIHKKAVQKLLEEIDTNQEKICCPIDFWLNNMFKKYDMKVFWSEPVLVKQGSEIGLFRTSIR